MKKAMRIILPHENVEKSNCQSRFHYVLFIEKHGDSYIFTACDNRMHQLKVGKKFIPSGLISSLEIAANQNEVVKFTGLAECLNPCLVPLGSMMIQNVIVSETSYKVAWMVKV